MKILFILVSNIWWFSLSPFNKFKNHIYTRYYKAANKMSVGKNVIIFRPHISGVSNIKIGRDCQIGNLALIDFSGGVEIGNGVTISDGVRIYTHNHTIKETNKSWRSQPIRFSPLKIGNEAWLGAGSIILENVSYIGTGAIIGAGSIVTKNIPDFKVVAGNPAKIIKDRKDR
jgi:acetyltransferase-like isoleucine patch superfamily enzyme